MNADPAAAAVARAAASAPDLDVLAERARGCAACPELAAARTTVVVGAFPTAARLLLVGEAPGAREDRTGLPFVGKAGALLDRLLADAGLRRADVAVANVVKCRPPGNRTPTAGEVGRCRHWLDAQLDRADPRLVVAMGATATAWALGRGVRIAAVRGVARPWRGRTLLVTYHPSAAIRFGPRGAPMAALRADLDRAAQLVGA